MARQSTCPPMEALTLVSRSASGVSRFFFYLLLMLWGAFVAFAPCLSALTVVCDRQLLLVCAVGFALLCTAVLSLPKYSLPAFCGLCGLGGLAFFFYWEPLLQGGSLLLGRILSLYSERYRADLLFFQVDSGLLLWEEQLNTGAVICLLFVVCLLLSWALMRSKSYFSIFLTTGFFLLIPMGASAQPDFWLLLPLLGYWVVLLFLSCSQDHTSTHPRRGKFRLSGDHVAGLPRLLALVLAAACTLGATLLLFPEKNYQRAQTANELRTFFLEGGELASLLGTTGVGSSTHRVNLGSAGERHYTGKVMLRVRTDNPRPDYLRNFVGSVYTGRSWELLPDWQAQALRDTLSPLQAQDLPRQFATRFRPVFPSSLYQLEVQHVNAGTKTLYAPYEFITPEGQPFYRPENDAFLRPDPAFSVKDGYVWKGAISSSLPFQKSRLVYALEGKGYELSEACELLGLPLSAYVREANPSSLLYDDGVPIPPAQLPEGLFTTEQLDFLETVRRYGEQVQDAYTQLPDSMREPLEQFMQEKGLTRENYPDIVSFTSAVLPFFTTDYTYSLSPGQTPLGQDFVTYFLQESKTGYCVHFASAAVLLFRAAGFPARYAEGLVAPPGDGASWQDLPDYRAHAWAEIYLSGYGWYPIDPTPNLRFDVPNTPPDAASLENSTSAGTAVPFTPTPSPTPEAASSSPTQETSSAPLSPTPSAKADASAKAAVSSLPMLLTVVVSLSALLAVLFLNRRLWVALRRRNYAQRDRSAAGLCVYAHLLRLRKVATRTTYSQGREPGRILTELAEKARFAPYPLTEEELNRMKKEDQRLAELLSSGLPTHLRLFYRYVVPLL